MGKGEGERGKGKGGERKGRRGGRRGLKEEANSQKRSFC